MPVWDSETGEPVTEGLIEGDAVLGVIDGVPEAESVTLGVIDPDAACEGDCEGVAVGVRPVVTVCEAEGVWVALGVPLAVGLCDAVNDRVAACEEDIVVLAVVS